MSFFNVALTFPLYKYLRISYFAQALMRYSFLILAFLASFTSFASSPADSAYIRQTLQSAQQLLYTHPDSAAALSLKALEHPAAAEGTWGEMLIRLTLGGVYFHKQAFEESQKQSLRALALARQLSDPKAEMNALNNIGNCYYVKEEYKEALKYYLQSLELEQKFSSPNIAVSYLNIGMVYEASKNYEKAGKFYQNALAAKTKAPLPTQLHAAVNLSVLAHRQKNYSAALENAELALKRAQQLQSNEGIGRSHTLRAQNFLELKRFPEALQASDSSLTYLPPTHSEYLTALNHKATALIGLGKFKAAAEILKPSLALPDSLRFRQAISDVYFTFSLLKKKEGDFKASLRYYEKFKEIEDTLQARKQAQTLQRQLVRFETQQKENEIQRLAQEGELQALELQRTQLSFGLFGLLVLLLAFLLFFLFRQRRIRSEQKLLQTQLRWRRAQMNPHFFFNALMALKTLVLKQEARAASKNLSKFATLMRSVLESSNQETQSLAEELLFLQDYVNVQQLRFAFDYEVILDEEIDNEELNLPVMLLQPFVENAIEHGLSHPEIENPKLTIQAKMHNPEELLVIIQDNGIGRQEKAPSSEKKISRATQITEDRAQLMQGKFRFEIKDNSPQGTSVYFYIQV